MSNWRTMNLTRSLIDPSSLPRESSSAKLNCSYWEMCAMDRRSLLQLSLASTLMGFAPSLAFADAATRPKRLRPGDTIGLVAPASVTYESLQLQIALEALEAMGLKAKVGPHVMDRYGYLAGEDEDRASDINAAFADPEIDAVFALRGGWGASRLLPFLDFDLIAKNPKIFLGYSDITSLLNAIYAKAGVVTFHGPNVMSRWNEFTYQGMREVLFDARASTYSNPEVIDDDLVARKYRIQTINAGKATGHLIGGNLTLMSALVGTSYFPNASGAILFLEDVGEAIYRVDRMMTQLKLSGVLGQVSGVVFGHFTDVTPNPGLGNFALMDILKQHCEPLGVPCYFGAMIGHVEQQSTVPVGAIAEMDAGAGVLRLKEPAVRK
ncbi:MAG: LD-carboxypeptidase [Pseudomonadota bacterium]|nr:LD-carboxypeptidase [Pseudomonadota bacterium]MEC7517716.1 LD-carboxypeptidase [Pseudomonadota bacterium]MEC7570349.1 LD-carboxypeptidase [Pseudomonadota bacterium]MEC8438796.1 LD-carboxypeptidase [Pseudomonadota bacterium]MEE3018438.1 LD-carboxypeptidase [Pseudomonadota bacterium]